MAAKDTMIGMAFPRANSSLEFVSVLLLIT